MKEIKKKFRHLKKKFRLHYFFFLILIIIIFLLLYNKNKFSHFLLYIVGGVENFGGYTESNIDITIVITMLVGFWPIYYALEDKMFLGLSKIQIYSNLEVLHKLYCASIAIVIISQILNYHIIRDTFLLLTFVVLIFLIYPIIRKRINTNEYNNKVFDVVLNDFRNLGNKETMDSESLILQACKNAKKSEFGLLKEVLVGINQEVLLSIEIKEDIEDSELIQLEEFGKCLHELFNNKNIFEEGCSKKEKAENMQQLLSILSLWDLDKEDLGKVKKVENKRKVLFIEIVIFAIEFLKYNDDTFIAEYVAANLVTMTNQFSDEWIEKEYVRFVQWCLILQILKYDNSFFLHNSVFGSIDVFLSTCYRPKSIPDYREKALSDFFEQNSVQIPIIWRIYKLRGNHYFKFTCFYQIVLQVSNEKEFRVLLYGGER